MTKNNNKLAQQRPVRISGGVMMAGAVPVSGVVHVIRDEAEVQRFREGEILVANATSPAWLAIFPLAKGVIAEVDGWLSHAAVVARAYDIPGIVGVPQVTHALRSGDIITMHTDGLIERLPNRREPDSPMRVSVPAAVHARQIAIADVNRADVNRGNVVSFVEKQQGEKQQAAADRVRNREAGDDLLGNG